MHNNHARISNFKQRKISIFAQSSEKYGFGYIYCVALKKISFHFRYQNQIGRSAKHSIRPQFRRGLTKSLCLISYGFE